MERLTTIRVLVKAKPNSKKEIIEKIGDFEFIISVKEPPIKGKANIAIMEKLSDHFNISISNISLISGFSSKNKIFEIKK